MRIAVLSDIHGNADALTAVLDDLAGRSVDATLCLGDHLSGPLEARRTADMLMASSISCIAGNHDRALVTTPRSEMGLSDGHAYDQLSGAHIAWLKGLPSSLSVGPVTAWHGTPASDVEYWLETVEGGRMRLADRDLVEDRARRATAAIGSSSLLLCGHTHIPRIVRLKSGAVVVNPGSVGLQGYTDDAPVHIMQVGAPEARYAVAEKRASGWAVVHYAVPYDTANVVRLAREAGREEWASALESGWIA
ncbi:metallophosphoesterase [Pleomorphomonas sp. NRK KF1]|uniref:metallophosphoesterase family protein n=1 Tax=Pleomorphomonas sp. NRK KF1 TaxID=2943000 RepID=UPI002044BD34|nr:metallophosphoesterase family protein [Pleomorphomonas sp. NRK KF1]MCM5552675.1 metallophosphatase family protein [Pleomorphomonas sp. NRK KF1]